MMTKTKAVLEIRRAGERGRTSWGWLDSRHTFSFGEYYDPNFMGFHTLRVINDDRVAPGAGFGTHGHQDMEILSYVLEGAMEHKDSMGTGSVIRPGEIQMMRAGSGITHSEFNQSKSEPLHFLQIWIVPDARGLAPSYAQRTIDKQAARISFALLASPNERAGSIQIRQDVNLWLARIEGGQRRALPLGPGRHAWIQVARGSVAVNGAELAEGDGAAISNEQSVNIVGKDAAEVLLFDLA